MGMVEDTVESQHPLVTLAFDSISTYVKEERILEPPTERLNRLAIDNRPAAVFVSLKVAGTLRGCIGTLEPSQDTLAEEIIQNAIGAATRDPRFPPVDRTEVGRLQISVDVLSPSEPVTQTSQLDYRQYGLIARCGNKQGVLLPDIEGIHSNEEQLAAVKKKAGCSADDPVELTRFMVTRYR